jgi:hypothetical protein
MIMLVYNLILKKFLEDIMQECPYKGRLDALNKTIGSIDPLLDLYPNLPTGEHKTIMSTFDGQHSNKSVFEVQLFTYFKGRFMPIRGRK